MTRATTARLAVGALGIALILESLWAAFQPGPAPPSPDPWCDANGPIYGACVLP